MAVDDDEDDAEGDSDRDGVGEDRLDGFRRRVCSDVDVVGGMVQEEIAHPAAGECDDAEELTFT